MHNCRKVEHKLVDLIFDEIDAEDKRRLLTEIRACAHCSGQYHSLSDTLFVVARTTEAALPSENYWSHYNEALRTRLLAPVPETSEARTSPVPFWKRLLAAKLPIPVPVAATLVVGLIVSSALAFRRAPIEQPNAPSPATVESVKIVEVPVVQEKIVTRTVYVERKRVAECASRAPLPAVARANELNNAAIAHNNSEEETGFFTRANLKGFQPADDMKIRVIKRNNTNDK